MQEVGARLLKWCLICSGLIVLLVAFHKLIFIGGVVVSLMLAFLGSLLIYVPIAGVAGIKGLFLRHQ